jgi:hypothetical protein
MLNDRASKALKTRINVVDLEIRSDSTENRLLKYAERGFAISAPTLNRKLLDREFLSFDLIPSEWHDGEMTLTGDDWQRLCDYKGILRLLAVEGVSKSFGGYIPDSAFKSRKKNVFKAPEEKPCRYSVQINAGFGEKQRYDLYPGTDKGGDVVWPSTTQVNAFLNSPEFRVTFQLGQMARKPKTWEEWGGGEVYAGADREPKKEKWDYKKHAQELKEKAEKVKAEAIKKGVEEALAKMNE